MRRALSAIVAAVLASGAGLAAPVFAEANEIAGGGYSSSYAGESVFGDVPAGGTGQFSAIFFNSGSQPWVPSVVGLLICATDKTTCNVVFNNAYNSGWYSPSVYATTSSTVSPGQNGFFLYDFAVPMGTPPGTATTFNGDLGLIATGALLRPEGYYQVNTVPQPSLSLTPPDASIAVGAPQQFTLTGAPADAAVIWSVTGGCATVSDSGVVTATAMNSAAQPCSVVASSGEAHVSAALTVFGQPTRLGCSADPRTAVANGGGPFGTFVVTVALKDVNGNLVANASTPAIGIANTTPGLGVATPTGLLTPIGGIVTTSVTTTLYPGNVLISAAANGVTGCTVVVPTTAPGPSVATASGFLIHPIAADGVSTSTLRIDLRDASGNRSVADNATVVTVSNLSSTTICSITGYSQGTAVGFGTGTGTATAVEGRVEFLVRSGVTPGACVMTVMTDSPLTIEGSTASLTTQIVGAPNKLVVVSNDSPHPAASGGTCNPAGPNTNASCTTLIVELQDFNGARVTSDNGTTVNALLDGPSCTGAGSDVVAAGAPTKTVAGRATFAFASAGGYPACSITFTSPIGGLTTTAAWTAAAPHHLACVMSPAAIINDAVSISIAAVTVRDVLGNVLTSVSYPVKLEHFSGPATVQVTSGTQTMVRGVASFIVRSTKTTGLDVYMPSIATGGPALASAPTSCSVQVKTSLP